MTVSCVADAELTEPITAPNRTMSFAGRALKLVPEIVTSVPARPEVGVKEVMEGTWEVATETAEITNNIDIAIRLKGVLFIA